MIDKIDQINKDAWDCWIADLGRALLSNEAVKLAKADNYAKALARMNACR